MHLFLFLFFWSLLAYSIWRAFISPWLIGPRKVKVAFQVDTDSAEKAAQRLRELQSALEWCVGRDNHLLDRISALEIHKRSMAVNFARYSALAHWIQDDRDTAEAEVVRLKEENKKLRKVWSETGTIARHREAQVVKLRLEVDQLQTQLAGCSTAARGGTSQVANRGDFGWSAAYQDILELRLDYERLRGQPLSMDEIDMSWLGRKPE